LDGPGRTKVRPGLSHSTLLGGATMLIAQLYGLLTSASALGNGAIDSLEMTI
jgi:hypothetical protein